MQAIELLLNRSSQPRLQAPAPSGEDLNIIMQAALRAPDHACLTPWQFVVCEGAGLGKLGEVFTQAAIVAGKSDKEIDRAGQLPLRAPMVIVAISKYKEHDKVPWVEQVASTSCAVHAMQMAAVALGYSGMWRTGSYAHDDTVKEAFNLNDEDEIVGFLYLGTPVVSPAPKPARDCSEYFSFWR
ncbi:NAD(P)H nitroreductase [Aestuariibacter salexigens]|uniref:NAD(P)H nitroreductase n=1 Tax=Aestuariibacter salexigens TaxID=226010 RepID=UPI000405A527|nr:NAD(P)H nitroreductase [Aestuariibacter salexigens]